MAFESIDRLKDVTINRYEAVIVAAQHARQINTKRLERIQQLEEGETEELFEMRKITAVALRDLMEGKVKFERPDNEEQ